jgi:hypothetical protein
MKQLIQDIGKEIRRIAVASEGYNAKFTLLLIALDNLTANGGLGGGAVAIDPRQFLLDDDGNYLLDDAGKRIYYLDEEAAITSAGTYHFIPVSRTAGTHALMPASAGVYYQVAFVFLSSTVGDTSWTLKDGATFQTGYTAGDIGFGAVIPLAENLFTTTAGNALNLVVSGAGTIQGHLVVYSYGD